MFPYSLRELGRQFGEREKAHEELSFDSSSGSEVLGGVSSNDSSFVGTLNRYFFETLAQEVVAGPQNPLASTDTDSLNHGISLRLRCLLGDDEAGFHLKSLETKCLEISSSTTSIKGMLNHLENLGHDEISSVEGLNVNLLDFQRQTLKWALERENTAGGIQNLFWAKVPFMGGEAEEIYYSPILNCFSRNMPQVVRGGIINEDKALGSATTSLALILQNPAPSSPVSGSDLKQRRSAGKRKSASKWDFNSQLTSSSSKRGCIISRGTLVVCHPSTYDDWISDAKAKLQDPDLVCKYYSPKRTRDPMELAMYPIVVTTYNVMKSDATYHAKKSSDPDYCPPLEQIRFWRVICEESHSMPAGFGSRIVSVHKWLVSDDPVSDTFENLRPQLRFLGVESIDAMFDVFSKSAFVHAGDPKAIQGSSSGGFGGLLFFLRSIMMRHTEGQTYRGTSTKIATLPGKSERTIDVDFDAYEKGEYEKLEAHARTIFKICVLNGLSVASTPVQDQLSKELVDLRLTCSIYGAPEKTKIVVAELQETDPHEKAIIFSQYSGTLQALRRELEQKDIHSVDLSVDKSARERSRAVNNFQYDPNTTVFLLSPTTAALDINFLKASRVYFIEPLLDQVLEDQIVGGVYRIGQKHPVEVVHLTTKNSIESRILQLCAQRPIASTNSTLDADDFDFLFGHGSDDVEL
jgi:SNF2 family DNA or RNA helicase